MITIKPEISKQNMMYCKISFVVMSIFLINASFEKFFYKFTINISLNKYLSLNFKTNLLFKNKSHVSNKSNSKFSNAINIALYYIVDKFLYPLFQILYYTINYISIKYYEIYLIIYLILCSVFISNSFNSNNNNSINGNNPFNEL